MYDHIFVVGNGKTSRANVEALIDDYIYANPKLHIQFHYEKVMSEGQFWLKSYAEDKKIQYTISSGSEELGVKSESSSAFFLFWSDEDPEASNALVLAKDLNIPAFDFTNGLASLLAVEGATVSKAPEIPEQELVQEPAQEVRNVTHVTVEDVEDFENEGTDPLYSAIDYIAKVFAQAIARELKQVLNK
jgi:hypothetical protein